MNTKKHCSFLFLCVMLLFFFCPSLCFSGAKSGITLWINTVIPSLLPFLLLSNIVLEAGLLPYLSELIYPLFGPLFGVSKNGCFPILIGVISGFPVGAKTCADLVKQGQISLREGQYLLSFVNNASPMFLIVYMASQCLHCKELQYPLYFIILLSSLICSIVSRIFFMPKRLSFSQEPSKSSLKQKENKSHIATILDHSIINSFLTVTKIGGYVILLSIVSAFLSHLPEQIQFTRYILLALTEMTTAISQIGEADLTLHTKIILSLASATSGGISSLLQTQSVIAESGLSMKFYIAAKLFQTTIVLLCTYAFLIIFR